LSGLIVLVVRLVFKQLNVKIICIRKTKPIRTNRIFSYIYVPSARIAHNQATMKKILILILLFPAAMVLAIITWVSLFLDHLFFPSFRHTKVNQPVFIVGMTRTASSWLHKTLYADRERFTSMKLWEMLFAPSIIQKKGFVLLQKLDKQTGGGLSSMLRKIDRYVFRRLKDSHPTSLFEIEEDDLVLIHILSNTLLVFIFPWVRRFRDLPWFDDRLSERQKKRIMHFYRGCIRRHLFVYGTGKTYLSKSPCHTPKIRSIRQVFPDSRFICTYRDPNQTISSSISLFLRFFSMFKTRHRQQEVIAFTQKLAAHWFSYPMKNFSEWPESDFIILAFVQLTSHPEQTINSLYRHFGYHMSDAYIQSLITIGEQSRAYTSSHQYKAAVFT
jgi:omega-hydroxy-beta-dihydromenaquinone-9 sulfotransferase